MRHDEPDHVAGRPPGGRLAGGRGQSTVELALVLPVVVVLALTLVQVGLVVRDQVRVIHAAREGARAAAVDPDPGVAQRAAERGSGFPPDRLHVASHGRSGAGSTVTVEVRYESRSDLPLVGLLLPDVTLTAEATMRVER